MQVDIKLEIENGFKDRLGDLVKVFRSTIDLSGDFVWIKPEDYIIDIGYKNCFLGVCTHFYKDFEKFVQQLKQTLFSINRIKQGISLYRSDMLYFSLGDRADVLREMAEALSKEFNVVVTHPFVPRITIGYSRLNYGASTVSNISRLINTFNRELAESNFDPSFKISAVNFVNKKNQKLLRKLSVS